MQAAQYVEAFAARGVLLWREGESLRYKAPPGVLTPAVLEKLRQAKPVILPVLPVSPSVSRDLRGLTGTSDALKSEQCSPAAPPRLPISDFSAHPGPLTAPPDVGPTPTEGGAAWFRAWAEGEKEKLIAAGLVPQLDPSFADGV